MLTVAGIVGLRLAGDHGRNDDARTSGCTVQMDSRVAAQSD